MKAIRSELQKCIQKIADEHGVIINDLKIEWMETTCMDGESYKVAKIKTSDLRFI